MTTFLRIFITVIVTAHHKKMHQRTQKQYCPWKNPFYKIHVLRIPDRPLRNYEDIYFKGREIINVVPLPTSLFTSISPLWELIIALAIANPSPDPRVFSLVDPR